MRTHTSRAAAAEPIERNVGLARELAERLCAPDRERKVCGWYHGFYPTLRALGLAATPERHAAFFAAALADATPGSGAPRVLVAGAADTAMPWLVWRTAPDAALRVIDRCATPLALIERAASEAGRVFETEPCDLAGPHALAGARPDFDLAVTHSLLVMIEPSARADALRAIAARLRPGGAFVSTARVDAAAACASPRLSPERAEALIARILAAAETAPALALDPVALAASARRYAESMETWPLASAAELVSLAACSGFDVERCDEIEVAGVVPRTTGGGGLARPARYAEFVLRRR